MEFVKNNVKLIDLAEPGRKIEYAGRVCYKSQDKISDDSYERFIKGIVNRGHTSVLEAERKMFAIPVNVFSEKEYEAMFEFEHYFNLTVNMNGKPSYFFVSGNIRAWYELLNGEKSIMYHDETDTLKNFLHKDYPYIFEIDENRTPEDVGILYGKNAENVCDDLSKHKSYTFEIVGSRSFTHQIVRHRSLSFSQESQRYCNYSKTSKSYDEQVNYINEKYNKLFEELESEYNDHQ